LPIYAAGSGYDPTWENQGVKATLQNRDTRIQLFTKMDGSIENYTSEGAVPTDLSWTVKGNNETRMVTGFAVKKGKNYDSQQGLNHDYGESGSIVFRGTEALLNYMEASWLKNHTIDATADKYWRALRIRAKVGDRYVLEMMNEKGWRIGGENSGHIICLDQTTTGDGIVAALQVLTAMRSAEMPLAKLRSGMSKFPQVLVNVRFAEGKDPLTSSVVQQEVAAVEQELAGRGRVLLRKSGTEPLIRVMVEGEHEQQVRDMAERIAKQVESAF
jgi:hypothetical protein